MTAPTLHTESKMPQGSRRPPSDLRIELVQDGQKVTVRYNLRLDKQPTPDDLLSDYLMGEELVFQTVVECDLEDELKNAKLRFLNTIHNTYETLYSANSLQISQQEHDELLHELRATGRPIFEKLIGD